MSSSADVTAGAGAPGLAVGGARRLLRIAGSAMVLVVANDEPVAEQIPYLIAFAMFGVVGALIVSRDRRNIIGHPVPVGLVHHRDRVPVGGVLHLAREQRGLGMVGRGLSGPQQLRMAARDPSRRCSCSRCCSRMAPPVTAMAAVPVVHLRVHVVLATPALRAADVVRLGRRLPVPEPLYIEAIGSLPSLDLSIGARVPRIFARGVLSLVLRFRRSTGVECQQVQSGWCSDW